MLWMIFSWSHLGLNQGPPDYESGATNQLSYRTPPYGYNLAAEFFKFVCKDTTKNAHEQEKT